MEDDDDLFGTDDGELSTKVGWVEEAEEASEDARKDAERDRDYYDNKQISPQEQAVLKKRNQPILVDNRIKRKVDYVLGIEARLRTDPKAYPRTPAHEDDAESATDAIRFVCDNNFWDQIRSRVWENLLIEGMGGADVVVEQLPNGSFEISVDFTRWDRIGYDPHSRNPDFSDAKYIYQVVWMDEEDVVAEYGEDARAIVEASYQSTSNNTDTYDDTPKYNSWADSKRKRVQIVQMWWHEADEWMECTFTKGGYLELPRPSPYLDENGAPDASLILASAYVDRDNNRYGWVRQMIGPQDGVNKRKSKAMHLLNTRRVVTDGTVGLGRNEQPTPQQIKDEAAKPDGYFQINGDGRFEVQENVTLAQSQVALLQEDKEAIESMGPNEAMTGKEPGTSGRELQVRQHGGLIGMERLSDAHRSWCLRIYRAIWNRVRQFWNEERWVRVTDDMRNMRWVGINQTLVSYLQRLEQTDGPEAVAAEVRGIFPPLMPNDPRLFEPYANVVAELDVDIVIDEGPDVVTLQGEQFDRLVTLFDRGIFGPDERDLLIEASDLRNKDTILERINPAPDPEQIAAEQAEQERTQAMLERGAVAEIENTEADTVKKRSEAAENMADTRKKSAEAENEMQELRQPRML